MPQQFRDEEIKGVRKGGEFRRLMRHFSKKHLLAIAFICSFLAGAAPLLNLIPMKKMTEMFSQTVDMLEKCGEFCGEMAIVCAVFVVLEGCALATQVIVAPNFMVDIRKALYDAFMYKDISYYDKTSTGAMISRMSEGVSYIKDVYIDQVFITIQAFSLSLGALIIAFCMSWKVTLVTIGFPIIVALSLWLGDKIADKVWEEYHAAGTESTEKAVEVLTEFRTVKSFDNEMLEAGKYHGFLQEEADILGKVSIVRGMTFFFVFLFTVAMALTILYYTTWIMVRHVGELTLYKAINVSVSVICVTIGINRMLSISDDFQKASMAVRNVLHLIEEQPSIRPNEGSELTSVKGKIEFRDVSFRYGGCEKYAVQHLSFTINAGETVAFVGESGCGKSTTLQLIQRFYDVESGAVLLDDVDIRTIRPKSLRSNIAIVPQGPVLFSMSIADNIKYGKKSATEDEVAEAARTGNAHDYIMELPQNYETPVIQTSLSGGQKQRLCISRAILANCPVLLLDEATAALDTESEQLVQQSLENFRHGKTAILVAHRLATVVHADRILVFKDGAIAETGTHQELLEKNGLYANLAKYQLE